MKVFQRPLAPWQLVVLGGGVGAVVRSLLDALWTSNGGIVALVANWIGSFALGFLITGVLPKATNRPWLGPFLGPGVLGGFTTMSGFAMWVNESALASGPWVSALYLFLSLAGGLAAAWGGLTVGRIRAGVPLPAIAPSYPMDES